MALPIKEHRKKLGLTQKALATKLGVSLPSVVNWENGKIAPRGKSLVKIEKFLSSKTSKDKKITVKSKKKRGRPKKITTATTPKKRGRPKKITTATTPKKRGRPKKITTATTPKKRGRPKKITTATTPKKRGRSKKITTATTPKKRGRSKKITTATTPKKRGRSNAYIDNTKRVSGVSKQLSSVARDLGFANVEDMVKTIIRKHKIGKLDL